MGYEGIQPGSLAPPDGNPFLDAYETSKEAKRKQDADRWAQVRDQGEGDRAQQRIGLEAAAQNDRLAKDHQDYIAQHTQKAMELDQAGMPLQAEAYAKLHNIPWVGSHRMTTPDGGVPLPPGTVNPHGDGGPQPSGQPEDPRPVQSSDPQQQAGPGPQQSSPQPSVPGNYQGGGLAGFDVDAASKNLAGVGQPHPDQSPPWTPIQGQQQEGPPGPQAQVAQVPQQSAPVASMQRVDRSIQGARHTIMTPLGPVEVDPMESENAHNSANARRAELYKSLMGKIPSMAGSTPEYAGLMAADEGIKGSDVLGMQKAEMGAKAKAREDADKEKEFLRTHPDVATQSKWQHERNLAIMAGKGGGGGGVPIDPKVLNAWETHRNHVKGEGLHKAVTQNSELLDRIDMEMGTDNPLNQAMAIHSLAAASSSIGANGGRVTVQASRDIKDAYGALESWENKAYRAVHGGQNMPDIVQKAQAAVKALRQVNQHNSEMAFQSYHRSVGTGSDFMNDPALAPHVADDEAATRMELGLPPEPEQFGDNGEANQPSPQPHHGRQKPHGKPAAPVASKPPTLVGPGGKTLTLGQDGLYH